MLTNSVASSPSGRCQCPFFCGNLFRSGCWRESAGGCGNLFRSFCWRDSSGGCGNLFCSSGWREGTSGGSANPVFDRMDPSFSILGSDGGDFLTEIEKPLLIKVKKTLLLKGGGKSQ